MNFLTRINYMKYAKQLLVGSLVLTLVSLAALFGFGLNKGIDFTGGLMLDLQFEQQVDMNQLRDAIADSLGSGVDPQVQNTEVKGEEATAASEFLVRVHELTGEQKAKLFTDLEALGPYHVISEEDVSGSVSSDLTRNAILAIAIAAVLQVIYITVRFQFKFGITAVLALLHDVVITLGVLSIFKVQINSNFVAAILTVLGYSMNDTVVVIDRIRENLAARKKGESLEGMTTRSIQEVITRSIYTGVSVQMMLVAMLIWGGESVWDFSLTLLIGIVAGTYSSIFVAAALWFLWEQADAKKVKSPAQSKPVKA